MLLKYNRGPHIRWKNKTYPDHRPLFSLFLPLSLSLFLSLFLPLPLPLLLPLSLSLFLSPSLSLFRVFISLRFLFSFLYSFAFYTQVSSLSACLLFAVSLSSRSFLDYLCFCFALPLSKVREFQFPLVPLRFFLFFLSHIFQRNIFFFFISFFF